MQRVLILMSLFALVFFSRAWGHPPVTLLDENGNPIAQQLNQGDQLNFGEGKVYVAGPPYSPKQTCGKCHDYNEITKAFHFREGVGANGEILSDTWASENKEGKLYKYLANAYAHLESPGQYGAW